MSARVVRLRRAVLARDLPCGLVLAQPLVGRLAQAPGSGPLGEADLGDEPWLAEDCLARRPWPGRERRRRPAQPDQQTGQAFKLGVAEAAADASHVAKLAAGLVDAE